MKALHALSNLLMKIPIKIIFITVLIIIILAIGAGQVRMATGNDTLVSSESKVYKDNLMLEEEFGGESIIVMYESEHLNQLLTLENLEHMKALETTIQSNDEIFTIISPVSMIEQMSEKQSEQYIEGLNEIIKGLDEMGSNLINIGEEFSSSGNRQDSFPNIDEKLKEMNHGVSKMIEGQRKLEAGTTNLVNGYEQFGQQIRGITSSLEYIAHQLDPSNPKQVQQSQQLQQISLSLYQLSEKMLQTSEKSSTLSMVPEQTIIGLKGIENGVLQQKDKIVDLENKQKEQFGKIQDVGIGLKEMGENLISISENLSTMINYSDTMKPGLPENQETLQYMLYDEGKLRDLFGNLIIDDRYMMMVIKFDGGIKDEVKSDIVSDIKVYLKKHSLEGTETMVSGKPVLDDSIRSSMKESMKKMMMLSIIFMILVLSVVFKVKWRLLPLIIILIAVIGTVGLMGWTNIPITMVSMAVFPILIGLGIDYAIQFQSRYSEEMAEGEKLNE